jgi:hypothetical protein
VTDLVRGGGTILQNSAVNYCSLSSLSLYFLCMSHLFPTHQQCTFVGEAPWAYRRSD